MSRTRIGAFVVGLVLAMTGGALFAFLRFPLPWVLGPLAAVALVQLLSGNRVSPPEHSRVVAQFCLGIAIGLVFRPEVARTTAESWHVILLATAGSLALGWAGAVYFHRIAGLDARTSYFSAAIGGAWEMHALAARYGANAEMVAAVQVLRISMTVIVLPIVFAAFTVRGDVAAVPIERGGFSLSGLAVLVAIATTVAVIARLLHIPNASLIGPLVATASLTAGGLHLSLLPAPIAGAAQVLMGWAMGSTFTRQFFATRPWFLASAAVYTVGVLLLSAGLAGAIALASGEDAASLVLGTAPGGVAEMALTAAGLHHDVPFVVSFHVVRIVAVAMVVGLVFRHIVEPRSDRGNANR